jgi:hypothetical protein
MFASTEIIGVDKILTLTKFSSRQNSRVDKNLASTKFWRRRRRISILFGSAESTAADFSQTSLMISYVSQKVLIPSHAVPKCGVASGCPAFMGGLSPAPYRLVVPASHAEKSQILAPTKYWCPTRFQDYTYFPQTIAVVPLRELSATLSFAQFA